MEMFWAAVQSRIYKRKQIGRTKSNVTQSAIYECMKADNNVTGVTTLTLTGVSSDIHDSDAEQHITVSTPVKMKLIGRHRLMQRNVAQPAAESSALFNHMRKCYKNILVLKSMIHLDK